MQCANPIHYSRQQNTIFSIKPRSQTMYRVGTSHYKYTSSLKWSLKLLSCEMCGRYVRPEFQNKLLPPPSIYKSSSKCIFYPADGGTSSLQILLLIQQTTRCHTPKETAVRISNLIRDTLLLTLKACGLLE
jgi:hypothetical protein